MKSKKKVNRMYYYINIILLDALLSITQPFFYFLQYHFTIKAFLIDKHIVEMKKKLILL